MFIANDLQGQSDVGRTVDETIDLKAPRMRWPEQYPTEVGAPFLLTDRASGPTPVDDTPYVFRGRLLVLTPRSEPSCCATP